MNHYSKLKINNVLGYSGTITIQTDKYGVPLQKFWRNRLKDAELDECVEIVKTTRKRKKVNHDRDTATENIG